MTRAKTILFTFLAFFPILAFLMTGLFEHTGCTGGFNTGDPAHPNCYWLGVNMGPVFVLSGTIAFMSAILAPFTIVWIGFWGAILFWHKRRTT